MYVDIDIVRPYIIKERLTPLSKKIFGSKESFSTSVITIIQLISDLYTANENIKKLRELKKIKLEILPLDEKTMKIAVDIHKKHKFSIHDSIHAASAIKFKIVYLSLKRDLDKLEGIERKDPYIFASENERLKPNERLQFFKF